MFTGTACIKLMAIGLSKTSTLEWLKKFEEGQESVKYDARSGRPWTSTNDVHVENVRQLVLENRRLTVPMANVLCVKRVASRLRENRQLVSSEMISAASGDSTFMKRIITGDESWVYQYDVETKQQPSEWRLKREAKPKRARRLQSKVKVVLTVFTAYGRCSKEWICALHAMGSTLKETQRILMIKLLFWFLKMKFGYFLNRVVFPFLFTLVRADRIDECTHRLSDPKLFWNGTEHWWDDDFLSKDYHLYSLPQPPIHSWFISKWMQLNYGLSGNVVLIFRLV